MGVNLLDFLGQGRHDLMHGVALNEVLHELQDLPPDIDALLAEESSEFEHLILQGAWVQGSDVLQAIEHHELDVVVCLRLDERHVDADGYLERCQ